MISIDCLPTKDFLSRRGLQFSNLERNCPWCNREPKKVEHLFFQCKFIIGFWRKIFEWWDTKWFPVEGFSEFFSLCNKVSYLGVGKSLWLISVTAACWSIWLVRNELVFDRKSPSMNGLVFQSKLRALMWVRAIHNELCVEEKLWWFCPIRSWNKAFKGGVRGRLWCPPRKGWVKFNLCGVVNEDEARCGGVLRYLNGVARAVFSGPIVAKDSLVSEVVAILIAFEMFSAIGWFGKSSLIIELGSKEVCCWLENNGLRPWGLLPCFREIDSKVASLGNVCFTIAEKNGNDLAFALVVAGIRRPGMYKA
ncbi:hypothetical protein ERO13_A09G072500v2 [Gossypium hirsutum]|uniref:Reverse transcriptase zinc-binding domain-containing protein n=3 Tax=Gossypium TaxID=3633 RepID=A0A5J5UFD8_GOSBA|nr:hypothetical protein ES319_A09G075700v1 [Gossypium barbadense]KAG4182863.1 hypothetical protein ERO13_A09G072500v2 [Gossypium hirsutum]TYH01868.1 hypothetical protein ES288_A09G094000v1 [Gossypium darwinii]TYJ17827.1 hypothetical protein E1A91_A09G079700v1 [Gossypium mustelinum]